MAQPLLIEDAESVYLITTRTAGSRLWIINNKVLEGLILGALARYQDKYGVEIYGFVLMGNHYHLIARFPGCNRAAFMRDFNSAVGRLIGRYVAAHGRRSVWARRYSYQVLPRNEDIKHWFYYVALNPVSSGLVRSIEEYPSYNSFLDAVADRKLAVTWIDWSKYLMAARYHSQVTPEDFKVEYQLTYSRLPGYEGEEEYERKRVAELHERSEVIVKERLAVGRGFLGSKRIKAQSIGTVPRSTKTSERNSHRPLVLTLCYETKQAFLRFYFAIRDAYIEASQYFREGNRSTVFPIGTYPPPLPLAM